MEPEDKKSDAEEILSEFQKTHGTEPAEEPQVESEPAEEPQVESEPAEEPQVETESEHVHQTHTVIIMGGKPIMSYVTATLTQLASLPIVTIAGRGKRITQAIDVSQMIVKRMNEVGYEISDVRISSDSLVSKDGRERKVSKIEIDLKNTSSS